MRSVRLFHTLSPTNDSQAEFTDDCMFRVLGLCCTEGDEWRQPMKSAHCPELLVDSKNEALGYYLRFACTVHSAGHASSSDLLSDLSLHFDNADLFDNRTLHILMLSLLFSRLHICAKFCKPITENKLSILSAQIQMCPSKTSLVSTPTSRLTLSDQLLHRWTTMSLAYDVKHQSFTDFNLDAFTQNLLATELFQLASTPQPSPSLEQAFLLYDSTLRNLLDLHALLFTKKCYSMSRERQIELVE